MLSNTKLTFEEHADSHADIHVPLQVRREVCACRGCPRSLKDTLEVDLYILEEKQ